MELSKEYEAAIKAGISAFHANAAVSDAIRVAVERCQKLADRPTKWLSTAEISKALAGKGPVKNDPCWIAAGQRVIAAHIAKQREPQVVKFRAARNKDTGEVDMLILRLADCCDNWEWLEPAQEFEVKV